MASPPGPAPANPTPAAPQAVTAPPAEAAPVVATPPQTQVPAAVPVTPTPEPVQPAAVAPSTSTTDQSLSAAIGNRAANGAPAEPRLPEPEDLISSYDFGDEREPALAGVGARSAEADSMPRDASSPYPDELDDTRFDQAVGLPDDDYVDPHAVSGRMRGFLEWGAVVVGALAVALIIKTFLMQAYFIPSRSMEPTLQVGDRVLVNKLSYDFGDISRGDLIVFNRPETQTDGEDDLIKRVIALPGETIEIREGEVFITTAGSDEQQLLREPYLEDAVATAGIVNNENCVDPTPGTCTIPEDYVFVMGDNRPGSRDSRFFGPIPEDLVVGRAFLRVWPLGDVGFL